MGKSLGTFEQFVLFALVSLGDEAYGASIRREIESRTGQPVSAGAVYTVLDRLEIRDLVSSRIGEPTAARGGRRRKHYRIEATGARLLRSSQEQLHRMSADLDSKLADLTGESR